MLREELKSLIKRWIKEVYVNDHNNAVFDAYNDFKNYQYRSSEDGWEGLHDCYENLDYILNDNDYIEFVLKDAFECKYWQQIIEDLENWEEK